jgi:protein ImuB
VAGVPRLFAVDPAARARGLQPGRGLADARAVCPGLLVRAAEPAADAAALATLGRWCTRYSPRVVVDGIDGLAVDLTGCGHLFGGEAGVLADLARRLDRLGLTHKLAVADGLARAWAWARFGPGGLLPAPTGDVLRALPVAALRLDAELLAALRRLGFRRIGQLAALPRAALATRFGPALVLRLDRLLLDHAEEEEAFVPLRGTRSFTVRIGWSEPIGRTEDILAAAERLLAGLCRTLEREQRGARRLRLDLHRTDGKVVRLAVGTSRPVREVRHFLPLLVLALDGADVSHGIELLRLEATGTSPLGAAQAEIAARYEEADLARLVDQLSQRLGATRVVRLEPRDSHVPERAQGLVPAASGGFAPRPWLARRPRPLRLLPRPQPVEAVAPVPDGPPAVLGWRGERRRVVAGTGPERIALEWWRPADAGAGTRDYHRVTLADGRRLWVYREGRCGEPCPPRWRLHGLFG